MRYENMENRIFYFSRDTKFREEEFTEGEIRYKKRLEFPIISPIESRAKTDFPIRTKPLWKLIVRGRSIGDLTAIPNIPYLGNFTDMLFLKLEEEIEEIKITTQEILQSVKSNSFEGFLQDAGLSQEEIKEIKGGLLKWIGSKAKKDGLILSQEMKEVILHTIFLTMKRTSEAIHK